MIARIFEPTGSFLKTCRYVSQDLSRAQVLYTEGVRGHDCDKMARDFELVRQLRETIGKPVFHAVLTFHGDEQLEDARRVKIAREYLAGVGMENTQYAIVRHLDAKQDHVHLVANRIDYSGELIHNFPEILRSRDTVEKLVREYALVPVAKKNLRQTNFDALDASDTRRYAIDRSIKECLPGCRRVEELAERLVALGIETRFREDATGKKIGISFLYQNEAFRGGQIDRDFTLPRLQKAFEQKLVLGQWEREKQEFGVVWQAEQRQQAELRQKEEIRQKQEAAQREAQQREELRLSEEAKRKEEELALKERQVPKVPQEKETEQRQTQEVQRQKEKQEQEEDNRRQVRRRGQRLNFY